MLAPYFEAGGPVMYLVLALWVIVLAGVLDRLLYALGALLRRPLHRCQKLIARGRGDEALACAEAESVRAARGLARIDAVSQIATSVGLFGTVLGITQSFFARGLGAALAAPEALASGLATALFTTVGGLIVFLFGQAFLIVWNEWHDPRQRALAEVMRQAAA